MLLTHPQKISYHQHCSYDISFFFSKIGWFLMTLEWKMLTSFCLQKNNPERLHFKFIGLFMISSYGTHFSVITILTNTLATTWKPQYPYKQSWKMCLGQKLLTAKSGNINLYPKLNHPLKFDGEGGSF